MFNITTFVLVFNTSQVCLLIKQKYSTEPYILTKIYNLIHTVYCTFLIVQLIIERQV